MRTGAADSPTGILSTMETTDRPRDSATTPPTPMRTAAGLSSVFSHLSCGGAGGGRGGVGRSGGRWGLREYGFGKGAVLGRGLGGWG
jgi:hypothetical protein